MTKQQTIFVVICILVVGWVLMFPTSQVAYSSPLLGFTVTPTPTVTPTVPTLPPPPTKTDILIPVTGADHRVPANDSLLTSGLVIVALGLVCLGLSMKKK